MAKFLKPDKLIKEIVDLFDDAEELIFIVSPFIKLDKELKQILNTKKNNPNFQVVLCYGKNENNHGQSLGQDDLNFFKDFSNVDIFYHSDLHAKYYANEFRSIVTSLNLHTYSIANNIEVGVLFERSSRLVVGSDNREDDNSFKFFNEVIMNAECIFSKQTEQKRSFFGLIKGNQKTVIEIDQTAKTHSTNDKQNSVSSIQKGFCIRTGVEIPYDLNKPFCKEAYYTWASFGNPQYPEKFCHFSGEKSNGQTTFKIPFLNKYEREAIKLHNKLHFK